MGLTKAGAHGQVVDATPRRLHVLVADDDPLMHQTCRRALKGLLGDVDIDEASTVEDAIALLKTKPYHAVLADHYFPGARSGLDILAAAQRDAPRAARILMTDRPDAQMALTALNVVKVHGFISKPESLTLIQQRLGRVLALF